MSEQLKPEIEGFIAQRNFHEMRRRLDGFDPGEVSALLEQLTRADGLIVFRSLPRLTGAAVFERLPHDRQVALAKICPRTANDSPRCSTTSALMTEPHSLPNCRTRTCNVSFPSSTRRNGPMPSACLAIPRKASAGCPQQTTSPCGHTGLSSRHCDTYDDLDETARRSMSSTSSIMAGNCWTTCESARSYWPIPTPRFSH